MTDSSVDTVSVLKGPLLALAGFAVFSSHDAMLKSLSEYSVFQTIFFAMLFGYVPFSLARIIGSASGSVKANNPKIVIFRSLLMVTSLCSAFLAFSMLPMVEVYVLIFLAPIIISLLAIYFLGEQVYLFRWFAIFLGLLGVVIVLRPSVETLSIGHFFGFLAAVGSGSAAIIARKVGSSENAATMTLYPLIGSILISGCILPFVYKPMPLQDLGVMFLIGVFGLTGQLLILFAYRSAKAAYIAPMQYSQMVWAVIFGLFFFDETIDKWVIIGSLVTIFSGVLIVWREATA